MGQKVSDRQEVERHSIQANKCSYKNSKEPARSQEIWALSLAYLPDLIKQNYKGFQIYWLVEWLSEEK